MTAAARVLVLGASGRLGGMLRRHWPQGAPAPLWQVRRDAGPGVLRFSPLDETPDCGPVQAVLGLAGVVPGPGADLALNTDLALAAVRLGVALRARRVFVASSAAVYSHAPQPQPESAAAPPGPYGAAKRAMEDAALAAGAAAGIAVTALRIGNVAGADALLGNGEGERMLDRFADGQGARRSWIGPQVLARALAGLAGLGARGAALPDLLNVAQPRVLAMEDLLNAAGIAFDWRPAPPGALACVTLDTAALQGLLPLPPASAEGIIADWRADRAAQREETP